jgi:hypothetical protein
MVFFSFVTVQPSNMMKQRGDNPILLPDRLSRYQADLVALHRHVPRAFPAEILKLPLASQLLVISRSLFVVDSFREMLRCRESAIRTNPNDVKIRIYRFEIGTKIGIRLHGFLQARSYARRLKTFIAADAFDFDLKKRLHETSSLIGC